MENWKTIEGVKGNYLISDKGRIINNSKEKPFERKTVIHHSGYIHIKIGNKCFTLHRLIGKAFIPNPENKPCINHKDGNKQNNDIQNLEWCTYTENHLHAYRIGLKKGVKYNGHSNKLDQISVQIIKEAWQKFGYGSQRIIGEYFGVDHATVSAVVRGISWKAFKE